MPNTAHPSHPTPPAHEALVFVHPNTIRRKNEDSDQPSLFSSLVEGFNRWREERASLADMAKLEAQREAQDLNRTPAQEALDTALHTNPKAVAHWQNCWEVQEADTLNFNEQGSGCDTPKEKRILARGAGDL